MVFEFLHGFGVDGNPALGRTLDGVQDGEVLSFLRSSGLNPRVQGLGFGVYMALGFRI